MGLCISRKKKNIIVDNPLMSLRIEDLWKLKNINPLITCPISQDEFIEPVIASDGHTYNKASILRWFQYCKQIGGTKRISSPVTGEKMESLTLYPNFSIQYIQRILGEQQQLDGCKKVVP